MPDPAALARRARDARSVRTKKKVLDAAIELFFKEGHPGFKINTLVQLTGIAKTTIYRHWETQGHLLIAVISRMSENWDIPDRGSLRADIIEYFMMRASGGFYDPKHRTLRTLQGLIQAAESEPGLANVVSYTNGKFQYALRVMVEHAIRRGEIEGDEARANRIVTLLHATLAVRAIISEELSDDAVIELIDMALTGINPRPHPA